MEPQTIASRYSLLRVMAHGGMATVHFGRAVAPGGFQRLVAIKRLHPHLSADPSVRLSFLDEARVASRIRHANVVSTLDVVTHDGDVFLIMEYVTGATLAELRSREPLDVALAAKILLDVLEGLHAAHEAVDEMGSPLAIVHRDVSPQNVIVGVDGAARVLDFGIAKAVGSAQTTQEGVVKGKAAYLAPEQLEGAADRRTDVYAAGIILWELLTGRRLIDGNVPFAQMVQALHTMAPPPSQHAPGVSPALDAVVLRAITKDPQGRYPTARAFADAIEDAVSPATSRAVARYVESVGQTPLMTRERALASLDESAAVSLGAPGDDVTQTSLEGTAVYPAASDEAFVASTPHAPSHSRARRVALALTILAGIGVVGGSLAGWSARTKPDASVGVARPLSVLDAPGELADAGPAVDAVETSAPVHLRAVPTASGSTAPRTKRSLPAKRPPKQKCDPPWKLDEEGFRVLIAECR